MKKILMLIILIPFLEVSAQSKVGTTAAPFLTNPVGSRAIGMGGAFVATSNDVTALFWNPAGIARIGNGDASFTRTNWFANITYNWAGATVDLGELGALGLNATYLDYGKMEVTTLAEYDGTGEYFTASDMVIGLTYSRNLTDRFAIGVTAKYVSQKIWNCSASALAFDFGVLFVSDIYGLRVGATITNFGEEMQLDGKDLYVQ
ncbi:MAG: PorV/PorQ family protein, partial [Ignavibacteriales bacterium]|nr:PorV/PorQ family protein [Ignavibacteriales bacterium]